MSLTNKYILYEGDSVIVIYEYEGCLYSATVSIEQTITTTSLYTTPFEAFYEAFMFLHKNSLVGA